MPKIFDNIENQLLDGLKYTLEVSYKADFCVGYFNLRGWRQVADKIDVWTGGDGNQCRLLVGMQRRPDEMVREMVFKKEPELIDQGTAVGHRKALAQEFREQLTIGIPTEADEIGLRKLSSQIKHKKVIVKLFLRHPLHAKLYLLFRDDKISPIIGYVGSSNLTLAGLKNQGELNVDVVEQDAAQKLATWFNDRWNDRWCIDISEELSHIIDESWAAEALRHPYHIYLKIAYHLAEEARTGVSEYNIPLSFRHLLPFQIEAVKIAVKKLDKRDGVLIGDVVGLGKTLVGCAIAKIFEEWHYASTLIICPPNLRKMWNAYIDRYDLKAKTLSIGEVQQRLPNLRRFRLVVIDESHNLRNDLGRRYNAIQEYIMENEPKVVLLTATPYNKTFIDLSTQLRLFVTEDLDLGISPERYIEQIGGPVQFNAQHSDTFIRGIRAFERSHLIDDWRELMRMFMVRRTRSFIKDNYAKTDPTNQRKYLVFTDGSRFYFPDRIPKKVEYKFNSADQNDQYARLYSSIVVDIINRLNLARYGLGKFLEEHPTVQPTRDEQVVMDNLSRAGKRLMGFCRTNLFKRLESSGHAFLLSISRHIFRNYVYFYALERGLPLPIGPQEGNLLDEFLDDEDLDPSRDSNTLTLMLKEDEYLNQASAVYDFYKSEYGHRLDWIRSELFQSNLKHSLIDDARELLKVLEIAKAWDADKDRQLKALHDLCTKNHPNEKIIIFSQFADTVEYLYTQLKRLGVSQIEYVTGNSEDPTDYAYRFSPDSNDKIGIKGTDKEIRVLISTDVLSEGQNLQDGHIVVNFDLPWALIRLIQRTGRVDRIGQKSERILCYSFLPEDGLEKIIRLRNRLRTRIQQNAEVVGSDEVFFEGDPVNLADLYNERAGILDKEDEGEVDLASYAYQIWKNATDANPELEKTITSLPNVVYATKPHPTSYKKTEGVVVYTRTADENDVLA